MIINGDSVEVMRRMGDASVDSIVTDPHYDDIARARIKAVEADAILARMRQAI